MAEPQAKRTCITPTAHALRLAAEFGLNTKQQDAADAILSTLMLHKKRLDFSAVMSAGQFATNADLFRVIACHELFSTYQASACRRAAVICHLCDLFRTCCRFEHEPVTEADIAKLGSVLCAT